MLASQEIAEAQAAREEREQIELESRHDVEAALLNVTTRTPDYDFIFLVARRKGFAQVTEGGRALAIVSYVPGHYGVTLLFGSK